MGSRLGRRVIHFANLPIKLLLPSPPFESIREIALKTVPSATKVEIRRVLESLYGFDVADVRTLNMEGKKIKRGPFLAAKPDYKKAYVTLRTPLALSPDIFPVKTILEDRERVAAASKAAKLRPALIGGHGEQEDGRSERKHWLDERRADQANARRRRGDDFSQRRRGGGKGKKEKEPEKEESKFPWSSMRLSKSASR